MTGWLVLMTMCARLSGWNELPTRPVGLWFPSREEIERTLEIKSTDTEVCAIDLQTGERFDVRAQIGLSRAWEPCKDGGCEKKR